MLARVLGREVAREELLRGGLVELPRKLSEMSRATDAVLVLKELHRMHVTHRPTLVAAFLKNSGTSDTGVAVDLVKAFGRERDGGGDMVGKLVANLAGKIESLSVRNRIDVYESLVSTERFDLGPLRFLENAEISDLRDLVDALYFGSMEIFARSGGASEALKQKFPIWLDLAAKAAEEEWRKCSDQTMRRFLQTRMYLRFCEPEMIGNSSVRAKLAARAQKAAPVTLHPSEKKGERNAVKQIREILDRKLRVAISEDPMPHVGPFRVDIKERDRRIVYQVDGAERFRSEIPNEKILSLRFQEHVLKRMGYRVVSVPHWHTERIKLKKFRVQYMRMSRYRAINDLRERAELNGAAGRTSDVKLFDAEKAALEYVGENFFTPEKMRRPWTWTRHRLHVSGPGNQASGLPTRVTL